MRLLSIALVTALVVSAAACSDDDGSSDETGDIARSAGAVVTRHRRNRGKAAAMESGAEAVRILDQERAARDEVRHAIGCYLE